MIDRFGDLPTELKNLLIVIETKLNCKIACIAKIETGARGAVVSFRNDSFPEPQGLFAYIQRLNGTAKLRPDQKFVIARDWNGPEARLNGALQLSKGLAKVAQGAIIKAKPPVPVSLKPKAPIGIFTSKR